MLSLSSGSVLASHLLAWGGAAFLAFAPVYGSGSTLAEVSGQGVYGLLLLPVLVTGLALAIVLVTRRWPIARGVVLVILAVPLGGLCIVGIFTIGMFYALAAAALVVGALAAFDSTGAQS